MQEPRAVLIMSSRMSLNVQNHKYSFDSSPQLSSVTSSLTEQILSHLFSQVDPPCLHNASPHSPLRCIILWLTVLHLKASLAFLQEELSSNTDLVQSHRDRINKASNMVNIELFWKTYNRWTCLHAQARQGINTYIANKKQRVCIFPRSRRDLNIDRNSTFK